MVSAAEYHSPEVVLVENVEEFTDWALYPAWSQAMAALGYMIAPHVVDCADLGVPQHRVRLFLVCTRSKAPLNLQLHQRQHVPASSFIDFDSGKWSPIVKPSRAESTLTRVKNGRQRFGERFIMPYYRSGSGLTGSCIERPIGTITKLDRWALVRGNEMRMLSADEGLAGMSFDADTKRPASHRLTMHMAGTSTNPVG
ncbi:C-5 cytosine-specific DNA methylase family protein [Pseudomonas syringae pv. maculicola]|nr:C-5 cytosine-specific DNA methylase family protein [Pseudomonas syringae pv. maculicola]